MNIDEFYADRYPDAWREFDSYMPKIPIQAFGFVGDLGDVNRWAARYRAGASYVRSELVQYQSNDTVIAYGALIRSILVWSAFERFLPIVRLSQNTSADLMRKYNSIDIARKVRAFDEKDRLFSYIKSKVTNATLAKELGSYFSESPFNASYLLSAIRHIFGHGHLTPGSNETDASVTTAICNLLCDFHLSIMNAEFSEHINEFKRMEARGWR